jgi:hypothetical protein
MRRFLKYPHPVIYTNTPQQLSKIDGSTYLYVFFYPLVYSALGSNQLLGIDRKPRDIQSPVHADRDEDCPLLVRRGHPHRRCYHFLVNKTFNSNVLLLLMFMSFLARRNLLMLWLDPVKLIFFSVKNEIF